MRKLMFILVFFVSSGVFASILPYPILSNHTNITESDAYILNNQLESEYICQSSQNTKILNLDFEDVDVLLPIGTEFELCDIETNQIFAFIRTGGKNHADIEPATTSEFEALKEAVDFSWKRRPAVVKVNDVAFLPCSFAAYPHGYSAKNTCAGHFCLHFLNSKTDGTDEKDYQHQKCIKEAAKKATSVIELFD